MKIVVVSPHRGDAALSLGLSIEAWLVAGHSLEILECFTRSLYAPYSDADSLHPNDRLSYVTALRAREDLAWTKLYRGSLNIADLRLKDAPLRLHCSPDEVLGRPPLLADKAFAVIGKGLGRAGADLLVLPLAIGRHVDGVTACEASILAAAGKVPCAFYEDLPFAAGTDGGQELQDAVVRAATVLGEPLFPVFTEPPASDPSASVVRKRRLALCYDSQIDSDVVEKIAAFCLPYSGRERLWASAAWRRKIQTQ